MTKTAELDVARRGQVFTPQAIVEALLALRRKQGSVLDPACGDGAFSRRLRGSAAWLRSVLPRQPRAPQ